MRREIAHAALDRLLDESPRFGEVALRLTLHDSQITRAERIVSEKVLLPARSESDDN